MRKPSSPPPRPGPARPAPAHPAAAPEFPRPRAADRLSRTAPVPFDETADEGERRALAGLFDARSVDRFRFSGSLIPAPAGAWRLEGRLQAVLHRTCVVTLVPVVTRLDEPVLRRLVPGLTEAEIDPEEEDEIEPLGAIIDLGAIAIEAAALALDPYPRAPGVPPADLRVAPPGVPAEPEADARPFAGLAALKQSLTEKG